jgi:uncharacterized protein
VKLSLNLLTQNNVENIFISEEIKAVQISFVTKSFGWMAVGLFISGITAIKLIQNYALIQFLSNYIVLGIWVIIHLGIVIWLSLNIEKMPSNQVTLYFIGFSILNGITIPSIFRLFTQDYFGNTFFILAIMFLIMYVFGYFTKRDLTSWSSLILMVLIGIGLNIWVNMVCRNDLFQLITTGVFMAVFVGLVVYDTNRIKQMSISENNINPTATLGAFALYLDLYYLLISIAMEENKAKRRINS